jgi:pyrimidine deaminase RibD-like protein
MIDPDTLRWMRAAIDLSRRCPPSTTAFSVGAIIVSADGEEIASGYSRQSDPHDHAEQAALAKLPAGTTPWPARPCTPPSNLAQPARLTR